MSNPSSSADEISSQYSDLLMKGPQVSELGQYLDILTVGNNNLVEKAVTYIRKLLSKEDKVPAESIIEKGGLLTLATLLDSDNPNIQFEALWALTNIAATEHTAKLATTADVPNEVNLVPKILCLMKSKDIRIVEQAYWCIGNIAGDNSNLRDVVLETEDALKIVMETLNHYVKEFGKGLKSNLQSLVATGVWMMSNLNRFKPRPPLQMVKPCIDLIAKVLDDSPDRIPGGHTLVSDACWALSYITDGEDERISAMLNVPGLLPRLCQIVKFASQNESNYKILVPALRTLGNVVSGNDRQTERAINAGFLITVAPLLTIAKPNIQKEAVWALSNVAAGTRPQINLLIDTEVAQGYDVLTWLISKINDGHVLPFNVKKEMMWLFANICQGGNCHAILRVVTSGALILMIQETKEHRDALKENMIAATKAALISLTNAIDSDQFALEQRAFEALEVISTSAEFDGDDYLEIGISQRVRFAEALSKSKFENRNSVRDLSPELPAWSMEAMPIPANVETSNGGDFPSRLSNSETSDSGDGNEEEEEEDDDDDDDDECEIMYDENVAFDQA